MQNPQTSAPSCAISLSSLLLGISTACLFYYRTVICKRPGLVSARPFRLFLERHCPVVLEKFCPTIWCCEGRMQTVLWPSCVSKLHVSFRNEVIAAADGGQLSLDWLDNEDSAQFPDVDSRPTVIFVCGLNGNSQKPYMQHLVVQANLEGYRSVVLNNRGYGGEEVLTHRTLCVAYTEDIRTVVCYVQEKFPDSPLVAVGLSLGASTILSYLADYGSSSQLRAAVSFSPLWNMESSMKSLETPFNFWFLHGTLIHGVKNIMVRYRSVIEKVVDVDYVLESLTIRQFDERYTTPAFGFQSCDDYYHQASPDHKLNRIQTPVICLNSLDDPFSPRQSIPVDKVTSNPYVALLLPSHGGHIGFLDGLFPKSQRYMHQIFRQFVGAVLAHGEELDGGLHVPVATRADTACSPIPIIKNTS